MDCEGRPFNMNHSRNIQDLTPTDIKKGIDLEEILHDQDLDALYIELMMSSDEAMANIQQDLEASE